MKFENFCLHFIKYKKKLKTNDKVGKYCQYKYANFSNIETPQEFIKR